MTVKKMLALAAAVAAVSVYAEDDEEAETAEAAAPAAETAEGVALPKADGNPVRMFTTLPLCSLVSGTAEVKLPTETDWTAAEEGKFYPLGSSFRTLEGGRMVVAFGVENKVTIEGRSSFATRAQALDVKTRTIELREGTLAIDLSLKLPEGAFSVVAPGFVIRSLAGESSIGYANKGDGDLVDVRCVTGTLSIRGRHFDVPAMRAADEVEIRTSRDQLITVLSGKSGDFVSKLDRGIVTTNVIGDDGEVSRKTEAAWLDWHLSVGTQVRISRLVPSIGERLSVAVMTFDAAGKLRNNFAFSEGRAEVNSGELVASKEDSEALAKKAAEATTEAAADTEEAPAKEEASTKDDEKSEEE